MEAIVDAVPRGQHSIRQSKESEMGVPHFLCTTPGRRVWSIIFVFAVLLWVLPASAPAQGSLGIERLMREAQSRKSLLPGFPFSWPSCCGDSGEAPAYPPDGFYGPDIDEECALGLATALASAVGTLIPNFLDDKDSETLGQGGEDFYIDYFTVSDFPELAEAETASEIIAACAAVLPHLHLREVISGLSSETETWGGACLEDGGGPCTYETCTSLFQAVDTCMDPSYVWTPGGDSPQYELSYNFYECDNDPDPSTYGGGGTAYAIRQRWSFNYSGFSARAHIYLKLEEGEECTAQNAPVAMNAYYKVTTASAGWSSWVGSNTPRVPNDCPGNACNSWWTVGFGAIADFEFEPPSNRAACDDETDLDLYAAAATTASSSEGSASGHGECGGGGAGGGPGGPSGAPGGGGGGRSGGGHSGGQGSQGGSGSGSGFPEPPFKIFPIRFPYTWDPVSAATGEKLESAVDLTARVQWGTFSIARDYTSKHDIGGSGLVGEHWSLSVFQFVRLNQAEDELSLDGWPLRSKLVYTETATATIWSAGGATDQTMSEATVVIDEETIDTWTLRQPGGWSRHFYRGNSNSSVPDELDGFLLMDEDAWGNRCVYSYALLGPWNSKKARLVRIFLDGTPATGGSSGEVVFYWNQFGANEPNNGRLSTIALIEKDAEGNAAVTRRVDYVYADDDSDLGTEGDLVQVTTRTLVDAASSGAPYRPLVTQYRYHNGTTFYESGDERLDVQGGAHQLKSVFVPQQIEFLAQELTQNGQSWDADEAVMNAAEYLRGKDDDDDVYSSAPRKVVDYAAKIVGYATSGERRVTAQYLQSSCGCAGAAQGLKQAFSYHTQAHGPTLKIIQYQHNGTNFSTVFNTVYCDMQELGDLDVPYLMNIAVIEPGGSPRAWVWHYQYDETTRNLERVMAPSAVASYTPTDVGTYAISFHSDAGLVEAYAYNSDHRLTEVRVGEGNLTNHGDFTLVTKYTYQTGDDPYLLAKIERFADDTSPTADETETTNFEYGFHSTASQPGAQAPVAYIRTIVESELESENGRAAGGSANTEDTFDLFDPQGRLRWTRLEDKTLTYREYDSTGLVVTKVVRNADPEAPDGDESRALEGTDFGEVDTDGWDQGTGGELVTTFAHDILGRVVETTSPGGVKSYTIREMREFFERPDILYYAEVTLPFMLANSSFDGPAIVSWMDASGSAIGQSEYVLDDNDYDPPALDYTLDTELSRRTTQHLFSGLVNSTREWYDIANNWNYKTSYTYDNLGRLLTTTRSPQKEGDSSPTYSITKNSSYDALNRVLEVQMGTDNGSPGDMISVAQYFYDGGASAVQGLGDGNLTMVRRFTGEPGGGLSGQTRDTIYGYDFRNRRQLTENPAAPHEWVEHDNLGRTAKRALFGSVPSGIGSSDRGLYTTMSYSQRGLVYRQQVAIDPGDLGEGYLETNSWFDANGRVIAEWRPNSPGVKRTLDGLGRVVTSYTTDRGGDAKPGDSGNYADAAGLDDDTVLEQTSYRYNDHNLVDLLTTRRRSHVCTDDGDLSTTDAVATFMGYYYDDADRRIRTVNFGTNTTENEFRTGGSAPDWPPEDPPDFDTEDYENTIVTGAEYNARGLLDSTTEPKAARVTKYLYDDLSRRIAVVENYDDATVSWSSGDGRWTVSGITDAEPDTDRVTSFVLDGLGNVTKQVAHVPSGTSESVQVTQYLYSTSAASGSAETDSLVSAVSLLSEVRYPDESTGEAGSTDAYKVKYSYNALGELRSVTDQNGTRHAYRRDDLGRVTSDTASALGTDIDGAVRRIGVTYDDFGRLDKVESYSDTSGSTAVNAARFRYTPLWQVAQVYQDNNGVVQTTGGDDGPPSGDTKRVQYSYETVKAEEADETDPGNFSRVSTLVYPDGNAESFLYAYALNSRISRVDSMTADGVPWSSNLIEYSYVGLDLVPIVDYVVASVQLDRTFSHDGKRRYYTLNTQDAGVYPGWDRFGRVQRQAWVESALTVHGSSVVVPNRPPLVETTYQYDAASNRRDAVDARPGASWDTRDFLYVYDELDRLVEAKRGVGSYGGSFTPGKGGQQWVLDILGNWNTVRNDNNGNGVYTNSLEEEDRTHNKANELTQRSISGQVGGPKALNYDAAGNMTEQRKGTSTAKHLYVHDAWNRLVKAQLHSGIYPSTPADLGVYTYNGLHWRIQKDADTNATSGLDQRRAMWYSASWQLLQEDVDDYTDGGSPNGLNRVVQEFWGLRYIDDPVYRRIDADHSGAYDDHADDRAFYHLTDVQFSTVAMVRDLDASLAERVSYSAYGEAKFRWPGDVDNDNDCDSTDGSLISSLAAANSGAGTDIAEGSYVVEADLNHDGVIDSDDSNIFTGDWLGKTPVAGGMISDAVSSDNVFGYDGYVFNHELKSYSVRFRWYDPMLGRWLERDPISYAAGSMLLYEYTESSPTFQNDASGLEPPGWAHCVPLAIGGDPNQLTVQMTKEEHTKQHNCLARELIGNETSRNWSKMREAFAALTEEQRTELLKRSLIESGMDPKLITDKLLKDMQAGCKPGTNRTSERSKWKRKAAINMKGQFIAGSAGLAFAIATGFIAVKEAGAALDSRSCKKMLEALAKASKSANGGCQPVDCSVLSGARNDAEQCAIDLGVAVNDAGVGGNGSGLLAGGLLARWDRMIDQCNKANCPTSSTTGAEISASKR